MKIVSEEYRYSDGDVPLTGCLVRPAGVGRQPIPALLLVHGGAGLDQHARSQARRYAALGYTVLGCDMFGPGVAGDRGRVITALTAMRDVPDLCCGNAVHGFTHADAVAGAIPGVAYDAVADRRSFQAACDFLAEVLPLPASSAENQSHDQGSSAGAGG